MNRIIVQVPTKLKDRETSMNFCSKKLRFSCYINNFDDFNIIKINIFLILEISFTALICIV